jgi:hypothetical protein
VINTRKAKAQVEYEYSKDSGSNRVRDSETTFSKRQSLTESQVLNAVTDIIMQEVNNGGDNLAESRTSMASQNFHPRRSYDNMASSMDKRMVEDLILEKMN